jgi:hypothetical protein
MATTSGTNGIISPAEWLRKCGIRPQRLVPERSLERLSLNFTKLESSILKKQVAAFGLLAPFVKVYRIPLSENVTADVAR